MPDLQEGWKPVPTSKGILANMFVVVHGTWKNNDFPKKKHLIYRKNF